MALSVVLAAGLGVGAGLWIVAREGPSGTAAPTAQPTATYRLVVRGHNQPVHATLQGGIAVQGTLYPALPGANTLRLAVGGAAGLEGVGPLALDVAMPGMAMKPIHATLRRHGGLYQGRVTLPMFGTYVARAVLVTPRGSWHGLIELQVPIAVRQ